MSSGNEEKGVNRPMVYVVDDDLRLGTVLKTLLGDAGYNSECFPDGESVLREMTSAKPDLMLLDFMLPGIDGVEVLRKVREQCAELPVIMMSGQGTIRAAVNSIQLGAYDFLEKPLDADRLKLSVRNALNVGQLRQQVGRLKHELEEQFRMVGKSAPLQRVRDLVNRVAGTQACVLVTGESGVGKELVARAVHMRSARSTEAFSALNCAAIPRELIESELFGYEKGAFTGASGSRKGKLQEADGGTLFLDEVGDMSLDAQAKLLRFLENMEVQRLGGAEIRKLDVRVVAATNKDLAACIKEGKFREDLYHRLNVVTIEVPSLRSRPDDIDPLADHFLARYCQSYNRALQLTPESRKVLRTYEWPGNVRELRNVMERAVVLAQTNPLEAHELQSFIGAVGRMPSDGTLEAAVAEAERSALERAMEKTRGNITEAARILGVERPSVYRIMKRHNITPQSRGESPT
jgi:DNA-binding NtrC family response regulator